MMVPILFICYVLFLNPEIILEEQCPIKPYSQRGGHFIYF
ncbi:hypothetical protein C663_2493 [Bacillus subtilis XF-1]|nr:hypothetical protein C663_2493 [Bacillus subtilis XF-1]ASK24547.1 hypothetical protein BSSX_2654 [Bacillus subtilis]